jgi:hypothetical protein
MKFPSLLLLLALSGCGSSGTPPPMMTDQQYCDTACASLIGCGVAYDNTCSTNCLTAAPVFLSCVKALPSATDCNALAICSFKQYAATYCGGGAGPTGGGSCNGAQACEVDCIGKGTTCACACISGMSSTKALNLLINNACSLGKCPTDCGPTGTVAGCAICSNQMCAAANSQCSNN